MLRRMREALRRWRLWIFGYLKRRVLPAIRKATPPTLQATALLGGWGLLTLTVWLIHPRLYIWTCSGALLLFSLAGWRYLVVLVADGLWDLATIKPKSGTLRH